MLNLKHFVIRLSWNTHFSPWAVDATQSFFRGTCKSHSGSSWTGLVQGFLFHGRDTLAVSDCQRRRFREWPRYPSQGVWYHFKYLSGQEICMGLASDTTEELWENQDTWISPSTSLCSTVHVEGLVRSVSKTTREYGELALGRWSWGTNGQEYIGTTCWDILLWGKQTAQLVWGSALVNLLGVRHQNWIHIIFSLSESFLSGRAETNLHFSLVQCHVVLCT